MRSRDWAALAGENDRDAWRFMAERDEASAEVARLTAINAAIRVIHSPVRANGGAWCSHCADPATDYTTFVVYPCPTVRALDDAAAAR